MSEWLDQLLPLAAIAASLWIAWSLARTLLHRGEAARPTLHIVAFCTHCGWEGRVSRQRMACARCGSNRLTVVST